MARPSYDSSVILLALHTDVIYRDELLLEQLFERMITTKNSYDSLLRYLSYAQSVRNPWEVLSMEMIARTVFYLHKDHPDQCNIHVLGGILRIPNREHCWNFLSDFNTLCGDTIFDNHSVNIIVQRSLPHLCEPLDATQIDDPLLSMRFFNNYPSHLHSLMDTLRMDTERRWIVQDLVPLVRELRLKTLDDHHSYQEPFLRRDLQKLCNIRIVAMDEIYFLPGPRYSTHRIHLEPDLLYHNNYFISEADIQNMQLPDTSVLQRGNMRVAQ